MFSFVSAFRIFIPSPNEKKRRKRNSFYAKAATEKKNLFSSEKMENNVYSEIWFTSIFILWKLNSHKLNVRVEKLKNKKKNKTKLIL